MLTQSGMSFVSRSSGASIETSTQVVFVDTMGELLAWYAAADLAFVGGSLVPIGGHNLLEPAALGIPTLCGPHMFAAQDVADLMWASGASLRVASDTDLASTVTRLAGDGAQRRRMSDWALAAVRDNRGALARTLQLIKVSA